MLIEEDYKKKLDKNEKELKELIYKFESVNEEIDTFFAELGTNTESVSHFLSNEENFDHKTWDAMQQQRHKLNETLQRELENIRNPQSLKKKYEEHSRVAPHWLFVR